MTLLPLLLACTSLLLTSAAGAQNQESKLEDKLKTYHLVLLKKGPHRDQDSAAAARIQAAHLANINRLFKEGKLDIAGPVLDDGDLLGIFVLNVGSREEAERLTKADPAVKAGRLVMEIHPWLSAPGSTLR
jgi:uncharacterized protein YciI